MTKVETNHLLITTTGMNYVLLDDQTLTPTRVVLFINSSSTEAAAGYHDTSVDFTGSSAYDDGNYAHTITHYRNISGTKTKVFEAIVTDMSEGEIDINVTTCTQSTTLRFVAFGS